MIRWLLIPLLACQCLAGSTNWLAQRPGLVSDYGNVFVNSKIPEYLYDKIDTWLIFSTPNTAIEYGFSKDTNFRDWRINGPTWTDSYGGGRVFDGNDQITNSAFIPKLLSTQSWTYFFWIKRLSRSTVLEGVCGSLSGNPYFHVSYFASNIYWNIRDSAGSLREMMTSDISHTNPAFVCLSRNGGAKTQTMYINGIQTTSASYSAVGDITTANYAPIGARNFSGTIQNFLNATLYEFGICTNYGFSSNEQFEVYNLTKWKYIP